MGVIDLRERERKRETEGEREWRTHNMNKWENLEQAKAKALTIDY